MDGLTVQTSNGKVEAFNVGGEIDARVREDRLIVHTGTDHATLLATLNDGRTR